jgi:hypothetical protein
MRGLEPDLTCTRSKDDAEGSGVGVWVCGCVGVWPIRETW